MKNGDDAPNVLTLFERPLRQMGQMQGRSPTGSELELSSSNFAVVRDFRLSGVGVSKSTRNKWMRRGDGPDRVCRLRGLAKRL